jgi:hypothetical protein
MSPLLAQSGHHAAEFQCPLLGVKQTLIKRTANKADMQSASCCVSQWWLWAEDELALKTTFLETSVCLQDAIERDPLGDARLDGSSRQ